MSRHAATVDWSLRPGDDFAAGRYHRGHTIGFDGGASLAGTPAPGNAPPSLSDPAGVDPEEMFVASVSACHMLWFLYLAAKDGWSVQRYRDAAEGLMQRSGEGRVAFTRIALRPQIAFAAPGPDARALADLHHRAHEACYIATSITAEVVVEGP